MTQAEDSNKEDKMKKALKELLFALSGADPDQKSSIIRKYCGITPAEEKDTIREDRIKNNLHTIKDLVIDLNDKLESSKVMPFIWEDLDMYTKRAKVLGGWIVKCYEPITVRINEYNTQQEFSISTTFVSDPMHLWQVYKE